MYHAEQDGVGRRRLSGGSGTAETCRVTVAGAARPVIRPAEKGQKEEPPVVAGGSHSVFLPELECEEMLQDNACAHKPQSSGHGLSAAVLGRRCSRGNNPTRPIGPA